MNHIHKFKRITLSKPTISKNDEGQRIIKREKTYIYKCMIPGCSTSVTNPPLLEGMISLCWRCGEQLVITRNHLQRNGVVYPLHTWCKDESRIGQAAIARKAKTLTVNSYKNSEEI